MSGAGAHLDVTTPAVVLKLDRNIFHHGGLGVIRSLGRLGVPVFGVHEDRPAPAAGSRYLRDRVIGVPDPADVPRLLAAAAVGRPPRERALAPPRASIPSGQTASPKQTTSRAVRAWP